MGSLKKYIVLDNMTSYNKNIRKFLQAHLILSKDGNNVKKVKDTFITFSEIDNYHKIVENGIVAESLMSSIIINSIIQNDVLRCGIDGCHGSGILLDGCEIVNSIFENCLLDDNVATDCIFIGCQFLNLRNFMPSCLHIDDNYNHFIFIESSNPYQV